MKAWKIMMFLLIFNLMIWTVDTGLHIYDLDYSSVGPDADETLTEKQQQYGLIVTIAGIGIITIVGSIAAAAIIGGVFKIQKASHSFVYGGFTTIFWLTYGKTISVFWIMSSNIPYVGLTILLIVTPIIGYIFISGLFQMVTGGWKSYV